MRCPSESAHWQMAASSEERRLWVEGPLTAAGVGSDSCAHKAVPPAGKPLPVRSAAPVKSSRSRPAPVVELSAEEKKERIVPSTRAIFVPRRALSRMCADDSVAEPVPPQPSREDADTCSWFFREVCPDQHVGIGAHGGLRACVRARLVTRAASVCDKCRKRDFSGPRYKCINCRVRWWHVSPARATGE
jgi:hypothetical protein